MNANKQNEKNPIVLRSVQLSFVVRPDWTDLDPNWTDSESTILVTSFRRRHYAEKIEQIYLKERRELKNKNQEQDHPFLFGGRCFAVWDSSGPNAELIGFSLSSWDVSTWDVVAGDLAELVVSDSLWVADRIVSLVRNELPQVGLTVTARLTVSRNLHTSRLPEIVVYDFRGRDYAESFSKSQWGK
jgi:hypothetical protein